MEKHPCDVGAREEAFSETVCNCQTISTIIENERVADAGARRFAPRLTMHQARVRK